jgi:predicted nucleic acid-binding protein
MAMNLLAQSYPIVPFDTAAAAIYAKLWQERKSSGLIDLLKIENGATRQELKADCMIVATAIQHKVKALYSHDASLRKFANGAIPVIEVPKLNQQFELTYV